MSTFVQLPNCQYLMPPVTITPCAPTPNHTLYLNNLDDTMHLRAPVNYVYLFKKSVDMDTLKSSLSRVLVDYYPLAGRLRISPEDENKLVVDCNGEGVVFVEASMDIIVEELLEPASMTQDTSWKKIKYNVEATNAINTPLVVIQVTSLRDGGMILCASINHNLCDAIGASQFLNAWAQLTKYPNNNLAITPFHDRHILNNRDFSPQIKFHYPISSKTPTHTNSEPNLTTLFLTQSLVTSSFLFGTNEIIRLKKQCTTSSFKEITSFEVVTAHTWRSLVKAINIPHTCVVKLWFAFNFRKIMQLPKGYYGNGSVMACVESMVMDLVAPNNLDHCVKLVQKAKASVDEEYIKSIIDMLEDKKVIPDGDGSVSLYITQWKGLGLEDVDFGQGKPLHIGPLSVGPCSVFLPVIGEPKAVRVLLSVPLNFVERTQQYMMEIES